MALTFSRTSVHRQSWSPEASCTSGSKRAPRPNPRRAGLFVLQRVGDLASEVVAERPVRVQIEGDLRFGDLLFQVIDDVNDGSLDVDFDLHRAGETKVRPFVLPDPSLLAPTTLNLSRRSG